MTLHEYFKRQFEYVAWADALCVEAVASVPADQFDAPFGFSFGGVHATVVHMMGAQEIWINRLTTGTDKQFLTTADVPTLIDLRHHWMVLHSQWRTFLGQQTDASLESPITFARRGQQISIPIRAVVAHTLDHSTHHRGQLNSLIKLAGGKPPECGWMLWSLEHGEAVVS
ncbi:MAG: hypothetical protein JWM57_3916 [Phycisphaerales bacterium]|nr:hypothetical protein [Phycisphaerales bacterium]